MATKRKIPLKTLNAFLTCKLCNGYLIEATELTECHHIFCRACILRYFDTPNTLCPYPGCTMTYTLRKKSAILFKSDAQLQSLVYKVVPGLYTKEMQRRDEFYSGGGGASNDSQLDKEREQFHENNEDGLPLAQLCGGALPMKKRQFFGPEDTISLSMEYYQRHLDSSDKQSIIDTKTMETSAINAANVLNNNNNYVGSGGECEKGRKMGANAENGLKISADQECRVPEKRYLQCPAAVTMQHLQKFVRMKYALTLNHRVDIIYKGEVLPVHFSLMDVAYSFNWKRIKPLRFFYRIFTPMKIQPIKIINTISSNGDKRLQVVNPLPTAVKPKLLPPPPTTTLPPPSTPIIIEENPEKERLFAHLQLQSKSKTITTTPHPPPPPPLKKPPPTPPDCVFEYEEPDKEEIKRFAEIRDREWALQKKIDEECIDGVPPTPTDGHHRIGRKRKKNKHSKSETNGSGGHKKRKIHAEITNKAPEQLKLKVKLTHQPPPKHKHHKNAPPPPPPPLLTPATIKADLNKEKLLQMRQVRHKTLPLPPLVAPIEKKVKIVEPSAKTALETVRKSEQSVHKSILKAAPNLKPAPNAHLEAKIANLQQRCTIETKKAADVTTASKRKECEVKMLMEAKRPSLEITLIAPEKAKRPPPATIPLERIKKSMSFAKAGAIEVKNPRCDNIGALDLSKQNGHKNGGVGLSNLQMLSKVATEHSLKLAPSSGGGVGRPRPQMPLLQTLKIPALGKPPLPQLNEIGKFRARSAASGQNQSIRSIPNVSLLVNSRVGGGMAKVAEKAVNSVNNGGSKAAEA